MSLIFPSAIVADTLIGIVMQHDNDGWVHFHIPTQVLPRVQHGIVLEQAASEDSSVKLCDLR